MHFTKQIGNTRYQVNVHCRKEGAETFEEKLLRILSRKQLSIVSDDDIITVSQVNCPPEGSTA